MDILPNLLSTRLAQLRAEHEAGQKMLAELDAKRQEIRDTLLRISGAIQVLDELAQAQHPESDGVRPLEEAQLSR
jgi:hypothetical protein